jgi:alkylation response protein AidB-like acyl-CoA dehydrogenase
MATDTMIDLPAFEREIKGFLDARLQRRPSADPPPDEQERLAAAKAWQRERFDAGLGWIMGPREYGGRELSTEHERLYRRLEREYDAPKMSDLEFGLTIVASAILVHGGEAAKEKYLVPLYRGEIVACQLWSEPGAGSDLAAAATRAVRDGDGWLISGQKVWTSKAHLADVGQCVCRTDMDAPKHRGITVFMVDMRAAGVEVRPLVDIAGEHHFNEVFLSNVRVSDDDRIGELNQAWRTTLHTSLMQDRAYVGNFADRGGDTPLTPFGLIDTLRRLDLLGDPHVRQGLADLIVRAKVAEYATRHIEQRARMGEPPGPESSMTKLAYAENQDLLVNFAADVLEAHITAADDDLDGAFDWARHLLRRRSLRIAGGSDQIQRTILGERVLGLPRDPAIDNSLPFKDIPRSARQAR